jgi:L-malate glycosyltransferase
MRAIADSASSQRSQTTTPVSVRMRTAEASQPRRLIRAVYARPVKRVLHVLPHPGGGGETYVDYLDRIEDYQTERVFITRDPTPRADVLSGAARAQLRARHYDLMHVEGEVAAALVLPTLALRPSVVTYNGLNLLRRLEGWPRRAASINLRVLLRAASATICVAEAERVDLIAAVGERDARRADLIRNGVDPLPPVTTEEREAARRELGVSPDQVAAVMIATLAPPKDPVLAVGAALRAAGEGAPLVLLLAGDGPLRPELEQLAAGRDAVRVLGFRKDVRRLLAASDVFVLSSWREGLSFAVLEAMSLALPPLVSDAPGNVEAVGDAGVVFRRGDEQSLTDAFRTLARDSSIRRDLGGRARERVLRDFRSDVMVEQTRALYERVLQ